MTLLHHFFSFEIIFLQSLDASSVASRHCYSTSLSRWKDIQSTPLRRGHCKSILDDLEERLPVLDSLRLCFEPTIFLLRRIHGTTSEKEFLLFFFLEHTPWFRFDFLLYERLHCPPSVLVVWSGSFSLFSLTSVSLPSFTLISQWHTWCFCMCDKRLFKYVKSQEMQ